MTAHHRERHFLSSTLVRDVVMGISDGLTVPFALAAGLSATVASTTVVVIGGIAEIAAGAVSMGLGGYIAARIDADHYAAERQREQREIQEVPGEEIKEVYDVLTGWGLKHDEVVPVVKALRQRPEQWVDFMMRFELGLERPAPGQAWRSGTTIGLAYVAGGLIPLLPYVFIHQVTTALHVSIGVTLIALFCFGLLKGRVTDQPALRSGLQTLCIGAFAAAVAFFLARLVSGPA